MSKRDPSIDLTAMKAMVTLYGPREAARKTGVAVGTMLSWARVHKWKKMVLKREEGTGILLSKDHPMSGKDAADVLKESLEKSRDASTIHLANYTEKASKQAAEHSNPLEVARKVRDVAGVYSTLWPQEEHSELIEGSILIGTAKVTDNPQEILALEKAGERPSAVNDAH
jgi:hypothetical protein